MKFQIEKGVPIPPKYSNKNAGITACLRKLEIGDSIVVDNSVKPSIYNLAKRMGIKITARREHLDTTRVWRIA